MKKNFFKKKLASGLALALVVASLSPAGVSAATATKIVKQDKSKAPTVLYVGNKGTDYTLSSISKANKYSWKISNAKLATVNAKTGVVTPKAPGTVTVKVTARNAKTNKWIKDFSLKLSIKQRATSVDIASEDFSLAVGAKKDLNAVKAPKASTDVVVYGTSDAKIATVNAKTGVVTAVAPGTATITVYAKALNGTAITSKYNRTDSVKVTVLDGVVSAKQTEAKKLELTFASDVAKDKIALSDISIVNDETKAVVAVKSVSSDGTKAVQVETFAGMTDGKVYNVTYDKKTVQFTATNNEVASLKILPATIAVATETEVKVQTVDAKGIILATYSLGNVTESKLEFSVSTSKGYTTGNKLYLANIGDTAKATATYHTYKYDTTGNEVGAIKVESTITAVDKSAVNVKKYEYTVATNSPNWNTYKQNVQIAVGDTSTFWLNVKKSDDSSAVNGDYTFASSNDNVLLVATNPSNLSANLVPVAEGSVYVLVKDKDGKVVWSLPVTVVAKKKAAALILDKDTITVSNSSDASIGTGDEKSVTISLKDQYGDKFTGTALTNAQVSLTTSGAPSDIRAVSLSADTNGAIKFNAKGLTKGTYQYKITLEGFTRFFTVVVVEPAAVGTNPAVTYQLDISTQSVDTKFEASSATDKDIVVRVAKLHNNILFGYVNYAGGATQDLDVANDTIVIKNGNTVVTGSSIATTASGSALTFKASTVSGLNVSKADSGSYSVAIDYTPAGASTVKLTTGFVITDTQAVVSSEKVKDNVVADSVSNIADAIEKAYKFTYEGSTISSANVTRVDSIPQTVGTTRSAFVKTAYVDVTIGTYTVPVKVTLNSTIVY